MAMKNKVGLVVLVCGLLASSIVVTLAYAQTAIPTPSVPEFTLTFADAYNEPFGIKLVVDNRPFNSYPKTSPATFFYNVREKGYFDESWTDLCNPNEGVTPSNSDSYNLYSQNRGFLCPSNSDYTVMYYTNIPDGQYDFEVQVMVGGVYRISPRFNSGYEFRGVTSDWSETQTITIPNNSASPSPSLTLTPHITESPSQKPSPIVTSTPQQVIGQNVPTWFYALITGLLSVIVVLLGIIIMQKRNKAQLKQKQNFLFLP
jgi:hypothetical protein